MVLIIMSTIPTIHGTVSYDAGDNTIYVYGTGFENMTTINTAVNDISILNESSSKTWRLTAGIKVNGTTTTLYINDTDCDAFYYDYSSNCEHGINNKGSLIIDNTINEKQVDQLELPTKTW